MSELVEHLTYLGDASRMRAYGRALRRLVRPGDRVVDLGCGTGILGFLALSCGARHVVAIDRGPVIHLARQLAKENGLSDRMTFVHADAQEVRLRRRADLLVTETMGNFGVGEEMLASVLDARRRYLRRDAHIIPRGLRLVFEPVSTPGATRRYYGRLRVGGFQFEAIRSVMRHRPIALETGEGRALAPGRFGIAFDLRTLSRLPYPLERAVRFRVRRTGMLHGWAVWFEAHLAPGITLSSRVRTHWKRMLLPVSPPLRVRRGERLDLKVAMTGEASIHWSGGTRHGRFAHSSWLSHPDPGIGPRTRPKLSRRSARRARILSMMDGRRTVEQIAKAVGGREAFDRVWRLCLSEGVTLNGIGR